MPPTENRDAFIAGVDRLGFKLTGALARIFGALAARDEEAFQFVVMNGANNFVDLTAVVGNTAVGTVQITQEADFVCTRILQETTVGAAGTILANPSYTVALTDGGTDRQLSNAEVHVSSFGGTAQRSVPWTKNRLFRRASTLTFSFTNLQATATRIHMVMMGYKVYDEKALDLVRKR